MINKMKGIFLVGSVFLMVIISGCSMVGNMTDNQSTLTGAAIFDPEQQNDGQVFSQEIIEDIIVPKNQGTELLSDSFSISGTSSSGRHRGGSSSGSSSGGSSGSSTSTEEVAWEEVYSYSDEYSNGGFFIDTENDQIEVSRAYVWRAKFGTIFNGKIQIVESNDKYSWYGSRLAIVDPYNVLVRYEIRLLPSENKLEIRYVDRTNRTGALSGIEPRTISEQLAVASCEIDTGTWYDVNIIRIGNTWKAQLFSLTNPTCFVEWEDNRISADIYGIGIQSAGKYVTSRFDTIIAI